MCPQTDLGKPVYYIVNSIHVGKKKTVFGSRTTRRAIQIRSLRGNLWLRDLGNARARCSVVFVRFSAVLMRYDKNAQPRSRSLPLSAEPPSSTVHDDRTTLRGGIVAATIRNSLVFLCTMNPYLLIQYSKVSLVITICTRTMCVCRSV